MKWVIFNTVLYIMSSTIFSQHIRNEHWYERNQQFINELDSLKTGGIIFLGNSITEGFDFSKYFSKTNIINRGINSDHLDGILDRLQTSVIKLKPAKLLILIGINDIGAQDSDSTILANYSKLLSIISEELTETKVYIHSILPTSARWKNCPPEKIIRLNKEIRILSEKYKFTWINIYSLFVDKNSFLKSDLSIDGLHLNDKGYQLWVKKLNELGLE